MIRGPFDQRTNVIAILVLIVGGALLLWFVLHYAFLVTKGLFPTTPPIR